MTLTFGSLFAGIGGIDLGLERAGMACKWQVEIDPWCRRVLAKHWPDVRRHDDVKTFPPPEGDWSVDVICGGFPCQDISNAGKRAGIEGERSGLWSEMLRVIRLVRPRFIIVENVAALLGRGMDRVLGDLSESGFDAEWAVLSAAQFGLPSRRHRVFIVAHPVGERFSSSSLFSGVSRENAKLQPFGNPTYGGKVVRGASLRSRLMPDWWDSGMAPGIPGGVDRLRGLGNAVVPQVAEWIGRRVIEANQG